MGLVPSTDSSNPMLREDCHMRAIERSRLSWILIPAALGLLSLGLILGVGCPTVTDDDDTAGDDDDDGSGDECGGGDCVCAGQNCVCVDDEECDITCETGGGNCAVECGPGSLCDVDCDGSASCAVECMNADDCEVDCSTSDSCAVTCPTSNCVVHNCDFGLGCAVTCGAGGIPVQQGDDWVCL